MKVVILCGGKGTRMKEETEYRPKPLVHIAGKPIIWHIMKIYSHYGIKDFILCLGYKGAMIKQYFNEINWRNNDYTIQTSLNYKQFHYSDTDVNFRTKRKDKKSDITLAVHKPINKEMLVNVASTYSNRDSNHASAEYDKYMLKANFLWNFKVH